MAKDSKDVNQEVLNELNSSENNVDGADKVAESDTASTSGKVIADKPKKSKLWLGILALLVVIIGCAGAYYYFFLMPTPEPVKKEPKSTVLSFNSAQEIIDNASPDLKGDMLTVETTDGLGGQTKDGYLVYSPPAYKVDGTKFKSMPTESNGTGYVADEATTAANYMSAEKFLKSNGFTAVTVLSDTSGTVGDKYQEVPFVSYSEYKSSKFLCALFHADATTTPLKNHMFGMGCASMDSYKQASEALVPFYDAYAAADNKPAADAEFGSPVVSKGSGKYEYAVLYQRDEGEYTGSLNGYYYREDEGDWTFFLISQGVPYCSVFDTTVVKQAFGGMKCYDETTKVDSKVS